MLAWIGSKMYHVLPWLVNCCCILIHRGKSCLFPFATIFKDNVFVGSTSQVRSGRGPKKSVPLANHSGNSPACTGATICRICPLTELTSVIRVIDALAQGVNDVHNILALPPQRWDGVPLINCGFGARWPILLHVQRVWADPTSAQWVWDLVCWKATLVSLQPHGWGSAPYCADNG